MSISDALKGAGAKPAGKRPYFMTPEIERVLAITMSVAQELAVSRQRCDTLERLLEAKGVLSRDEIENYAPDKETAAIRGLANQEYIARILRIVQQENEAIALKDDILSEEVAEEVSADT